MQLTRLTLCASLAILCAAGARIGFAQGSVPSATEQGLLVGLGSGATRWLTWRGDSLSLAWSAPYIVVPRRDGYWQISSAERCSLDTDSAHGGGGIGFSYAFREHWQGLAIARAGERAIIRLGGGEDCDAAASKIGRIRLKQYHDALAVAKGDTSKVQQPSPGNDYIDLDCITQTEQLTFVSANSLGIESRYRQTEACSPGGYTTSGDNVVRGFRSTTPIRLYSLISPRVLAKGHPTTDQEPCTFADVDSADPSWLPRRSQGRWIVSIWKEGPNVCRGGFDTEYEIRVPQSFTGGPPLPIAWAELRRSYPSLLDACASPSHTLIALVVNDTLIVRRVANGQLGAELGRVIGIGGRTPVMYRWATAAEATRWSADLPALPQPRIRIIGSQR